ncbi:hypothetical protein AXK11_05560 [Cephaloticoccus primus]|uniref:DNA repair protein RecO n=1 Tax=Cephaloticoccus primus TaxID=1548207 RepID=A0A139SMR8_9BACT|nr:hypothetical protein [Cephaloticoccus primus]KXU35809.1 hypothetical protein AXK11_05560 [Cephaloticoccus primus]
MLLKTQGIVLVKRLPREKFQGLTVFSAEHGQLDLWQRLPKNAGSGAAQNSPRRAAKTSIKGSSLAPLDLFDEAEFLAESPNQGQSWFIKESRLLHRESGIARSYDTLRHACEFTAMLARNPVPEEVRAGTMRLLRQALSSFATSGRPDIVHLKALYCFARDEGYPLRQHWLPALPAELRALAGELIHQPIATQSPPTDTVATLHAHLCDYLRTHTEILVD